MFVFWTGDSIILNMGFEIGKEIFIFSFVFYILFNLAFKIKVKLSQSLNEIKISYELMNSKIKIK